MEIVDPHRKRILSSLNEEKIVLFIGAGCSKECGIPDSTEIVDILKSSFSEIHFQNETLLDVCYDIVETPPYTKSDILKILKEVLIRQCHIIINFKKLESFSWTINLSSYQSNRIFLLSFIVEN